MFPQVESYNNNSTDRQMHDGGHTHDGDTQINAGGQIHSNDKVHDDGNRPDSRKMDGFALKNAVRQTIPGGQMYGDEEVHAGEQAHGDRQAIGGRQIHGDGQSHVRGKDHTDELKEAMKETVPKKRMESHGQMYGDENVHAGEQTHGDEKANGDEQRHFRGKGQTGGLKEAVKEIVPDWRMESHGQMHSDGEKHAEQSQGIGQIQAGGLKHAVRQIIPDGPNYSDEKAQGDSRAQSSKSDQKPKASTAVSAFNDSIKKKAAKSATNSPSKKVCIFVMISVWVDECSDVFTPIRMNGCCDISTSSSSM